MKKIYQVIAVAALLFVPFMVSEPVSAQTIENTGPGSNNEVVVKEDYKCEVDNSNVIIINNKTNQNAGSGTVSVEGNGTGGGAVSGSVSNNNQATFNVKIENGTCLIESVVPQPQPETPEEPTPGRGEAPVQPTQNVTPKALPVTSGDTAPVIFLVGSLVATGALVFAYRRLF